MTDEFYHKNIFGTVVDINLGGIEAHPFTEVANEHARTQFNVFAITDALGTRNKKEAWILYQRALSKGFSAEEVFFKIVWQIKSMLIASRTKNVEETDMKDHPYKKAKSFLKNFKPGELEKLSESLAIGYYRARKGEVEIQTFVEKLLLSL